MRVLVCGGRDYEDWRHVYRTLSQLAIEHFDANGGKADEHGNWMPLPGFVVIHGGCNCGPNVPKDRQRGADFWANEWCVGNWIEPVVFYADWHPNGGPLDLGAGPKRNSRMLAEGKPDLVVAFPGGSGTADLVSKAKRAGVKVMECDALPPPTEQQSTMFEEMK